MQFLEYITEAGVALNGVVYPKFNNIVILAGGSASGKGFVLNNSLLIDGKVFDIDNLKDLVINDSTFNDSFLDYLENHYTPKNSELDLRAQEILSKGLRPSELDLKNPLDTSILHFFTSFKDYDNRLKRNFFIQASKTPRKPNVIFDVTMRNLDILDVIYKFMVLGGYEPENVHLVWVLNSVQKALEQNRKRKRSVTDEIVLSTHRGVSETMKNILRDFNTKLKSGVSVSELIDGDVWIVPNLEGVDSSVIKSSQDNSVITSLSKFQVKESKKPLKSLSEMEKLLDKINSYVPLDSKWS